MSIRSQLFFLLFVRFFSLNNACAALEKSEAQKLADFFSERLAYKLPKQDKIIKPKIILNWENERVNAHATIDEDGSPLITVQGGMIRHELMNQDSFIAILCHELGHHLGGAPKQWRGNSNLRSWSSAEGQADYYSASKCLPLMWKDTNSEFFGNLHDKNLNQNDILMALKACNDHSICARIAISGLTVARIFASQRPGPVPPKLERKTDFPVYTTLYEHPTPQCRVETFLAGAKCLNKHLENFDANNPFTGACEDGPAARPTCWFMADEFR